MRCLSSSCSASPITSPPRGGAAEPAVVCMGPARVAKARATSAGSGVGWMKSESELATAGHRSRRC